LEKSANRGKWEYGENHSAGIRISSKNCIPTSSALARLDLVAFPVVFNSCQGRHWQRGIGMASHILGGKMRDLILLIPEHSSAIAFLLLAGVIVFILWQDIREERLKHSNRSATIDDRMLGTTEVKEEQRLECIRANLEIGTFGDGQKKKIGITVCNPLLQKITRFRVELVDAIALWKSGNGMSLKDDGAKNLPNHVLL
jgi:hypothetical protein